MKFYRCVPDNRSLLSFLAILVAVMVTVPAPVSATVIYDGSALDGGTVTIDHNSANGVQFFTGGTYGFGSPSITGSISFIKFQLVSGSSSCPTPSGFTGLYGAGGTSQGSLGSGTYSSLDNSCTYSVSPADLKAIFFSPSATSNSDGFVFNTTANNDLTIVNGNGGTVISAFHGPALQVCDSGGCSGGFTPAIVSADYSLPLNPSDYDFIHSWFDHDATSSQMTRYDGMVFYGNDADISTCTDGVGCYSTHHGIDFGTYAEGTNVLAAASGTVASLGWQNPSDHHEGYGYYMRIYHPQFNQSTIYGHATTTATFFSVNDSVGRGATILLSGATGGAIGQHLHFGVTIGDTYNVSETIDPFGWSGTSTDPRTNDKGYLWKTNPPSL